MWNKFMEWAWRQDVEGVDKPIDKQKVIDVMADDVDPNEVTIENAYKTRWIWYHTILAIGIFFTNILLTAILVVLAIKL